MFNNFEAVIVCHWKPRIFSHNTLAEMCSADVSACALHSSDSALTSFFMLHLPPFLVCHYVLNGAALKLLTIIDLWEVYDCDIIYSKIIFPSSVTQISTWNVKDRKWSANSAGPFTFIACFSAF